jgi:hypothetical protein
LATRPCFLPAKNGDKWLIRTYRNLEELRQLPDPPESRIRPFPIRWSLTENEAPQWEKTPLDFGAQKEFCALDDCFDLYGERYKRHLQTKVGGWPSWIQSPLGSSYEYVFQISSEEKPGWMWGDNGNGYFFTRDGEWEMVWDCY